MSETIGNIVNAAVETGQQAVNYVSETLQGNTAEAQAKVNKEEIKSDNTSIGQKASAAGDYLSNKADQKSHEGKAELNEQKLKN